MLKLLINSPLFGLVLGPIVTALGDAIHNGWTWLDRQKPIIKQAFAVVLSFALVGLMQFVPGVVPDACANVAATGISTACENALASGPFLTAIVSALVAVAVKHGQKTG